VYERNLDWFRFWLQGYESPDPNKKQQYTQWREMREMQQKDGDAKTGWEHAKPPERAVHAKPAPACAAPASSFM
jgi:hypothetical protein